MHFKNVLVFVCLDVFSIILDYIKAVASVSDFSKLKSKDSENKNLKIKILVSGL